MTRTYDAIVVGSGAAGGWAAKELTELGLDVILLEGGPMFPKDIRQGVRTTTEARRSRQTVQTGASAFNAFTADYFVDDVIHPYSTPDGKPFSWIRGRQLGGRMHLWGRGCLRFSSEELERAGADGNGESWPITYDDLAPYYDRVERFLGITGSVAGLAAVPDGIYRYTTPFAEPLRCLKEALEARWPDRRLLPGRIAIGEHELTIAAGLATGRLTIRTNAVVSHLILAKEAPVAKGVAFVDRLSHAAGEAHARIVLLCASAFESVRILLNSRDARFTEGVGSSSDVLGRYLLDHTSGVRMQAVDTRSPEGVSVDHHPTCLIPNFCRLADGFARGYGTHVTTLASNALFVNETSALQRYLSRLERQKSTPIATWCFGEVLPRRENHLRLDPNLRDAWGIPAAHIDFSYSDNERKMGKHQSGFLAQLAELGRLEDVKITADLETPGSSIHELGGARMGSDPRNSVVNALNQCWDVPNVLVADGACFVSAGWQNPALTIMALAARACHHAVECLKDGRL